MSTSDSREKAHSEAHNELLKEIDYSASGGQFKGAAPSKNFIEKSFKAQELQFQTNKFEPSKDSELKGNDNCTASSDTGLMCCPG